MITHEAARALVDDLLVEIRGMFRDLGPDLVERGMAIHATAELSLLALVEGRISPEVAHENVKKLTDATRSELIATGYRAAAKRLDLALVCMKTVFKFVALLA